MLVLVSATFAQKFENFEYIGSGNSGDYFINPVDVTKNEGKTEFFGLIIKDENNYGVTLFSANCPVFSFTWLRVKGKANGEVFMQTNEELKYITPADKTAMHKGLLMICGGLDVQVN